MLNQFKIISQFIRCQIIIVVICTLVFFFWKGTLDGFSAFLGGGIAVLPEVFFIAVYFKKTYARFAKEVVTGFYLGEALKWLLTLGLFTVAFQWSKLKAHPLFVTFIAAQVAFWLVPLIYEHQRVRIHTTSSGPSHRKDTVGHD